MNTKINIDELFHEFIHGRLTEINKKRAARFLPATLFEYQIKVCSMQGS